MPAATHSSRGTRSSLGNDAVLRARRVSGSAVRWSLSSASPLPRRHCVSSEMICIVLTRYRVSSETVRRTLIVRRRPHSGFGAESAGRRVRMCCTGAFGDNADRGTGVARRTSDTVRRAAVRCRAVVGHANGWYKAMLDRSVIVERGRGSVCVRRASRSRASEELSADHRRHGRAPRPASD